MSYFNKAEWDQAIQQPDWYMGELWDEYTALIQLAQNDETQKETIKNEVRGYFVDRIARNMVAIATASQFNLDAKREAIDTVVIHHTSGSAEQYTLPYLNVVHLLQIYAPYFRNPSADENFLRGAPLQSGHEYEGKQVFWGYHWLIDGTGQATRILPDTAIGWQAGNWEVNKRSVAICFAGNFMQERPNESMITAARSIIEEHYEGLRVIGHREVNQKTACPGESFALWQHELTSI